MTIIEEFPKTAMNRRAADVWTAATRGPVSLSDYGTSRFVLMPRDQYDELVGRADPRLVRATADIPDSEADALVSALQNVIDADD